MSVPRPVSALDLARDRSRYDLDAKPERWLAGPPFDTLDIRPGRVLLFGAPPGAGKTTFALQLVTNLLDRYPALRCVVGNVETAAPVLLDKLLARFASVDFTAVMNRELLAIERQRIDDALRDRANLLDRLAFLDPPFSVPNLFGVMKGFDARLAVVDYVQRFAADDKEDRAKLDTVMSQIRTLADQGAAVLVISSVARQKNRNGGSTYGGLTLAAFRGSAELEFGADSAFLLHSDPVSGVSRLECVKERFGRQRDISLRFCGEYQRFDAGDLLDGFDAAPGPSTPAPAAGGTVTL
ncbi:DnaB-like helicase C-terminal domain-containing protein [Fimbriiglobus ruber]|uniref:Replicative DNA helicase n=1 Tax=Fimbriiglobus ruber TaxID=1908690 RepID=A0A225D7C0_9BACT|nr:DnaB-like helicase C-terminal domain-containing protein [Fimbriiglobus ruber]OWK35544.1 Replicative DNA helicase [Fimbriiglobus ruber]